MYVSTVNTCPYNFRRQTDQPMEQPKLIMNLTISQTKVQSLIHLHTRTKIQHLLPKCDGGNYLELLCVCVFFFFIQLLVTME